MFTDKEITAYRNIKAPDDLCRKITKPKKKHRKVLYFSSAIAACLVLVISGFVYNNQSNIVVNGQKLKDSIVYYDSSLSSRRTLSSSISVPIEINAKGETKVVVLDGFISTEGYDSSKEIVLTSTKQIWWELETGETDNVFEMLISNKKGVEKVTLIYENTKITVTKEKVK